MALVIFSAMSINTFSAPKEVKKLEWKQISLEPDLDGDGIKDKIDVDYAVEGNNVRLKFTPYVFNEKAKFTKGKSVEKTITKSEFEAKFDTLYAKGEVNIPFGKKVTVTPSITYVTTDGDKVPETYRPKLGGFSENDYSMEFGGIPVEPLRAVTLALRGLSMEPIKKRRGRVA